MDGMAQGKADEFSGRVVVVAALGDKNDENNSFLAVFFSDSVEIH